MHKRSPRPLARAIGGADAARPPRARAVLLVAALLATLAQPGAHAAEGDDLAELLSTPVYAASKHTQRVGDAPASVSVLTQGDIRAFGWRTLGEILEGARGVHLRDDRTYPTIGVRGVNRPGDYSSRVLVLIDGVRINEVLFDAGSMGRDLPIDVSLIERVEFLPGPGSAIYGSNAVFGVVNVVTRDAANLRGLQAEFRLGSDRSRRVALSGALETGQGALTLAAASGRRPGGDVYLPGFDLTQRSDGWARGSDGEEDHKLFARWRSERWAVQLNSSVRHKNVPTAPYLRLFGAGDARFADALHVLGTEWHSGADDGNRTSITASLGHVTHEDFGTSLDGYYRAFVGQGRWWQTELRRTFTLDRQRLMTGVELQRAWKRRFRMNAVDPTQPQAAPVIGAGSDGAETRVGLYVNDEIQLDPTLRLNLGARASHHTGAEWRLSPRLALLWRPQPTLVVKLLAGTAFREPNAFERLPLTFNEPVVNELQPEQLRATELALRWSPTPRLRISASTYRNRVHDLIEQVVSDDDRTLVYQNFGSATTIGQELEADYMGEAGWRLRASVSHQRVQMGDGSTATNAPQVLAKLHGSTPLGSTPLRLGVEVLGMSKRKTLRWTQLPAQVIANLTLQYLPPGQSWSLAASLYNATDRRVFDPSGPEHQGDLIPRDRRNAELRLQLGF